MADSYQKKEREKKRRKRKEDKKAKKLEKQNIEEKTPEFMYVDFNGNLTSTPPELQEVVEDEIKLEDVQISTPKGNNATSQNIREGIVKFFKQEENYGFIMDTANSREYYVHAKSLKSRVHENSKVRFELSDSPRGKVASNVQLLSEITPKEEPKPEAKVEPKVEGKEEPKTEAKVEAKVEAKAETKTESTEKPKEDTPVETKE